MNKLLFWIILLIVILLATCFVLYYRRKTRKILERVNLMLDKAMEGNFEENNFDESMLSQVETMLAHYLESSEVSKKNLGEEKNKIKELISDISHQTKTPIANIMLYTQLLGEQKLPSESINYVNQLNEQTNKLNFLVGSLVKTSRLETGIMEVHSSIKPISPMLQSVILQVQPKAEVKHITIIQKEVNDLNAYFDSKWTEEAIYNILDNAVKYSDLGKTIEIHVVAYDLFTGISIADHGIGIREEEQAKIFGRFYRSPEVSEKEGVGIGLYLSRQIVTAQGGYIKVSSVAGQGATFTIYLRTHNRS